MPHRLEVIAGPDLGRVFLLPESDTVLLGRSRATETRLTDPHVSRVHCHVQVEAGRVRVTDFDSAGGTFINDQPVTCGELKPGDVLRLGTTRLVLLTDSPEEPTTLPLPAVAATADTGARVELARLVGQTMSGYVLGPILAEGPSGLVFHATDTEADRPVALKVIWPGFLVGERQRERFLRSMRAMVALRHPNVAAVYEVGHTGVYCWVAQEYIEGESLTQVIQRAGSAGPLDWRDGLRVAVHVGRALALAGRHHVVHRNLTPMNVLLRSATREAVLSDLKLAQALEGAPGELITRPAELAGDVRYMSPERTYGSAYVDGRGDVYSLGAVVYALLTGRPPFEGPSAGETVVQIRQAAPTPPAQLQAGIPEALERVVLTMLAKQPAERYATADDLLSDLERLAQAQRVDV
jgi:serine/threonine-protein kinase